MLAWKTKFQYPQPDRIVWACIVSLFNAVYRVSVSATGSNCLGGFVVVLKRGVLVVSVSATGSNCLGSVYISLE